MAKLIFVLTILAVSAFSCKNSTCQEQANNVQAVHKMAVVMPQPPKILTSDTDRNRYILEHYWQSLEWNDTTLIESDELAGAFYCWAGILASVPEEIGSAMSHLIVTQGNGHPVMQSALFDMALNYFEDPNSPYRNEELLIPILKAYSCDESIPQTDRIRPKYLLEQYDRNRKGSIATNLAITMLTGSVISLSNIIVKAGAGAPANRFVLLYFFNPDCHDCERVGRILTDDSTLKQLRMEKKLHVAAIYPDQDLESWNAHIADPYPSDWTVGYLNTETERCKYYLPAIPNLYLLDSTGRIILKDATIEMIITYLSEVNY